jgi:hypothetical protein
MTVQRKYWLFQSLGWGAYSIFGVSIAAKYIGFTAPLVIGYVLFFAYSIALTDLFRREIKRRRWLELPTYPPAPRVLRLVGGVILIGLIQTLSVVGFNVALDHSATWPNADVLWMLLSVTYATGMWTVLYLQFTARRRNRERETAQQLTLRQAELRALESQINPHFLFNCLNSIRALVVENPPAAQDMLTRLANILRHSLQQDRNHTVPLAAEVSAASDYLALESIRFEDRLRVKLDVDRDTEAFPVPSMLLQTLVENAVKHGIAPRRDGGDLTIRARIENVNGSGQMLRLNVENTGSLPDPETSASSPSLTKPLGLANTRERLQLLYQGRAALELTSHNNLVVATVLLPSPI